MLLLTDFTKKHDYSGKSGVQVGNSSILSLKKSNNEKNVNNNNNFSLNPIT